MVGQGACGLIGDVQRVYNIIVAFERAHSAEILGVPSHQRAVCAARVETRWQASVRVLRELVVPHDVEDRVFVALAVAETLHLRIEDIPDIDEFVEASCGEEVSARAELDAVKLAFVAAELQILRPKSLCA